MYCKLLNVTKALVIEHTGMYTHTLMFDDNCYFHNYEICDCLSENLPSSHLPVFRKIPF